MLHSIEGYGYMMNPVSSDIHQVDVITLAQLLEHLSVATIGSCLGLSGLSQYLLAFLNVLRQYVAQSHYLRAWDVGESLNGTRTSHAQAYKPHTYGLQLRCPELQYIFLSVGTLRNYGLDGFKYLILLLRRRSTAGYQ
jgi:hypothetical protein